MLHHILCNIIKEHLKNIKLNYKMSDSLLFHIYLVSQDDRNNSYGQ